MIDMYRKLFTIGIIFSSLFGKAQTGHAQTALPQTDIAKVRQALDADKSLTRRALPAGATKEGLLERIDADGHFKRPDPTPVPEDLTDTLVRIAALQRTPEIKDKLYRGLQYWLDHHPRFQWTGSAMAQPTALGWLMLQLYDDFQQDRQDAVYGPIIQDIHRASETFVRFSWSNGKNQETLTVPSLGNDSSLDWQRMGNLGYRLPGYTSILAANDDEATMDTLSLMVSNQFSFKINKPGAPAIAALYDGSLQQHGPQIFNEGYGGDWLNAMGSFAGWVKGTRWELTRPQCAFWANMLLNGMQWMTLGEYTAHNIVGRHTSQKGSLKRGIAPLVDKFLHAADITTPGYAAVLALRNGNVLPDSVKYFWNSDVILEHSPRYFASIRMLSDRVVGVESSDPGTGQGINNFYMADGSALVYRHGTEYDEARLGWDWRCIPGTTVKQKKGPLPFVPWSHGYESDNHICGGVSEGHAAIGLFNLSRTNPYARTKAYKAYFTFPDLLLCMGNSIRDDDTASGPVYTTIEQTERRTAICYSVNGSAVRSMERGDSSFVITSPSWFWQDSVGYIILPPALLVLKSEERTGNWHDLDKRNPDEKARVDIFQLSIDHVKDNSYEYVVLPAVGKKEMPSLSREKTQAISISANNAQVVAASYAGYTGLFFLEGGGTAFGITSDKPVGVLLKDKEIYASDITNSFEKENIVHLTINHGHPVTLDLSKSDPIYVGEGIHITTKQ